MKRTAPISIFAAVLVTAFAAPSAAVDHRAVAEVHKQPTDWQTVEARRLIEPLILEDASDPSVLVAFARLQFMEADYGNAVATMARLADEHGLPREVESLDALIRQTYEALAEFDEFVSEDRRFLIRYTSRDKALIPFMLPVLQAQDAALARDFGYKPKGQVVVEIYPEIKFLASVSPLTEEAIETSGTIALCKYNRLMFTSPRAMVRGYGWQDTMAHEFTHYYVTKRSHNTVPIWLHEGIAKFQETRWRSDPAYPLAPPQEDLLARSIKGGELITFDQMHPSMALLPSQEAASLAFAEVHTVIDWMYRIKGYAGINALMDRLRVGDDMNAALERSFGHDLDGLWTAWRGQLKSRGFKTYPGLVQTSLKFKKPGQTEDEAAVLDSADYATIDEKRIKDLTHIAELMRARDRHLAALKEYRKAEALAGDGNPVIQNGAARSLLELGRPQEVPQTLLRVSQYYETYLTTWLSLGDAWSAMSRPHEAIDAYERARGVNPFHPRVHEALAKLYADAHRDADAALARKSLELLQ